MRSTTAEIEQMHPCRNLQNYEPKITIVKRSFVTVLPFHDYFYTDGRWRILNDLA